MKPDKIFEVLNELKARPRLMRKLKIFLLVGLAGFIFTGSLLIWAGISTLNFVASKTNEIMQSPVAQEKVEVLKSEVKSLPRIKTISCWGKAQSLLAVQPWLERTALDNLMSLKSACLEPVVSKCNSADCRTFEI